MNCSTTVDTQNRHFLNGNFGASVFMTTYIGLYGMGLIIYFACQFLSDARENHEEEVSSEFFRTLQHINERQAIYSQLTDENLVKKLYKIYYSDVPCNTEIIEEKANQCSRKYNQKMQNLKSKHQYYVTELPIMHQLTSVTCTNEQPSKALYLRSFST